jgi:uncharacterized coiled-coil protein SlyX
LRPSARLQIVWVGFGKGNQFMRDETENLILTILKEIQARTKGLDDRMANLELRLTAQEQHLGTLVLSLPSIHDRLDALTRRMERVESRLELRDV